MKRTNYFIPTLIALTLVCAASQPLQAQAPARQAFPWSSATASATGVAETVSRASSTVQSIAQAPMEKVSGSASRSFESANEFAKTTSPASSTAQSILDQAPDQNVSGSATRSFESTNGSATKTANDALAKERTIYVDQQGNEISREAFQAKITGVQNQVTSVLPSTGQAVQSFEQNFGQNFNQHITPLQSVDNSAWGKAKSVTSKATSFWKKPSLFKTPEGLNLPSTKTKWAKAKFDQPTTWFSKKTTDPITFVPLGSLPRAGKTPTSIDSPNALALVADQAVERLPKANFQKTNLQPSREFIDSTNSIFEAASERVASEFSPGNDFDPRR